MQDRVDPTSFMFSKTLLQMIEILVLTLLKGRSARFTPCALIALCQQIEAILIPTQVKRLAIVVRFRNQLKTCRDFSTQEGQDSCWSMSTYSNATIAHAEVGEKRKSPSDEDADPWQTLLRTLQEDSRSLSNLRKPEQVSGTSC